MSRRRKGKCGPGPNVLVAMRDGIPVCPLPCGCQCQSCRDEQDKVQSTVLRLAYTDTSYLARLRQYLAYAELISSLDGGHIVVPARALIGVGGNRHGSTMGACTPLVSGVIGAGFTTEWLSPAWIDATESLPRGTISYTSYCYAVDQARNFSDVDLRRFHINAARHQSPAPCAGGRRPPKGKLSTHPAERRQSIYTGSLRTIKRGFRSVGLEVEFVRSRDRTHRTQWCNKWGGEVVTDGSCGLEAVTPVLNTRAKMTGCVTDLCYALISDDAVISDECSVHTHVDASDLAWSDIMRLCKVWSLIEPAMYVIGGECRVINSYCRPVSSMLAWALRTRDPKGAILALYECGPDRDATREDAKTMTSARRSRRQSDDSKKGGWRYAAMNLQPWITGRRPGRKDLTVEFRLHRSSLDSRRLTEWASLLSGIVQWVATHNDADADRLPKSGARAICAMVPTSAKWVLARIKGWRVGTSVSGYQKYTDAGSPIPQRLVKIGGGVWSCAA